MGEAAAGRRRFAETVFAGEEAAGERAEGGVAEAMLRAVGDQRLRIRGRRANCTRSGHIRSASARLLLARVADRLHVGQRSVGDAEAVDFAGLDSTGHGLERFFERRHAVEFVNVIEVDPLEPQAAQRLDRGDRRSEPALSGVSPGGQP